MHSALMLAKYIIHYCHENDSTISARKLQRVLYLIQASAIRHSGRAIFRDSIRLTSFGLVIPAVHEEFRLLYMLQIPQDYDEDTYLPLIESSEWELIDDLVRTLALLPQSKIDEMVECDKVYQDARKQGYKIITPKMIKITRKI